MHIKPDGARLFSRRCRASAGTSCNLHERLARFHRTLSDAASHQDHCNSKTGIPDLLSDLAGAEPRPNCRGLRRYRMLVPPRVELEPTEVPDAAAKEPALIDTVRFARTFEHFQDRRNSRLLDFATLTRTAKDTQASAACLLGQRFVARRSSPNPVATRTSARASAPARQTTARPRYWNCDSSSSPATTPRGFESHLRHDVRPAEANTRLDISRVQPPGCYTPRLANGRVGRKPGREGKRLPRPSRANFHVSQFR